MKAIYSATPSKVEPAPLDNRALIAIGRLVRACAEIEDLVNLFICNLAEINESRMIVMLGRTPISKKVEIAEYLAKINSPEAARLAVWAFDEWFWGINTCRNAVAHGLLLGKNEENEWSFLTSKTEAPIEGSAIQLVASYSTETIEDAAGVAERAIPQLEENLRLKALRQSRYRRPLDPHRKGLRQQKRGAKPKPPQKPSRA